MSKSSRTNFRPLQIINEERSTHGLRYGDYTRYRKHCAHKTHRLRATLKLTHGKGREFRKFPPMTPEGAKDGHLLLLLFETERAWAHAQELSSPQESRRSTSRYRRSHGYLSRLVNIARSSDLPTPLSAQSTIELIVYGLIHTARLNLRRPSSSTAVYYGLDHNLMGEEGPNEVSSAHPLVQLSVAYALLDELEKTACTSKEVALARAFMDEIGPEIRWCVHEFGRGADTQDEGELELERHVVTWKTREWDIEGIVAEIAPAYATKVVEGFEDLIQRLKTEAALGDGQAEKRQVLEELIWDGEPVPVRNPELVDVLLKVQEASKKLGVDTIDEEAGPKAKTEKGKSTRGRIARYDGVLLSLSDAVDQARKLVEAQQVSGTSSISAPGRGTRDIHFMHAYLTYLHLTHRIERDLLLVSALASQAPTSGTPSSRSPQNTASILHLLSGILQSLSQALTLPITDESPDLSTAISARLSHAKAQRTFHLARAYAHPSHKKYAEALSLTQRGHLHIREAQSTLSILTMDSLSSPQLQFYPLNAETLNQLNIELAAEEERYKIGWFAHNGGVVASSEQQPPHEKHKKALFFDIAFNYVEPPIDKLRARADMPPLEELTGGASSSGKAKVEKEEKYEEKLEEAPAPKGGLTGFLGSWWGRG